ncbi:MAG: GFA family protein [Arenicellales bacterium]
MVKGSCLCGAVEYEVELIADKVFNCHCSLCRKSHGAAFATQALVIAETLRFLKGEELLSEYQGRRGVRAFCSSCGSKLMNYAPDKSQYLSVSLACVDSDVDVKPVADCFVGSKADWSAICNDIPSFKGLPRET